MALTPILSSSAFDEARLPIDDAVAVRAAMVDDLVTALGKGRIDD